MIFVAYPFTIGNDAVGIALEDLVVVATALARQRAARGGMPEQLADLVPEFLPASPPTA